MSIENFERFMKQVDDSQELQAKIGAEITGEALVALGAAHGCEFSIEDLQAGAELSDAELEGVSGGATRRRGDVINKYTDAGRVTFHIQEACANGTFLRSKKSFNISFTTPHL